LKQKILAKQGFLCYNKAEPNKIYRRKAKNMNRVDLISAVAKDTGLTKVAAEAAIVSVFGNITDSLKKVHR
jgi:hypothetical protein